MDEPVILALEGSSGVCSAALLRINRKATGNGMQWEVLARRAEADGRGQARVMLRLVDEMLQDTGHTPRDLAAVIVGTGPGTFTGVRITVATARAMSLALSVPVLGSSSLSALVAASVSAGARAKGARLLIPLVDARRGQVFYGLYRLGQAGTAARKESWLREAEFAVCDRGKLASLILAAANDERGPGNHRSAASTMVIAEEAASSFAALPAGVAFELTELRAEWLLRGQERLREPGPTSGGERLSAWVVSNVRRDRKWVPVKAAPGEIGTPEAVAPIYVRPPDADFHITRMRDPWAGSPADR